MAWSTGTEGDLKDQLLCRLEQQQTVHTETIERLERSRNELLAFQKAFSLIYDQAPVGYITFDKRGHISSLNKTLLRMLGHESARVLHLPISFLVHPQDAQKILTHLWRCGAGEEMPVVTALRLRRKDQGFLSVELVSTPFAAEDGRKLFLSAVMDLTERSRHERELSQTKDFSEAIVQTVRHPLAVLDTDLRIISVNRAFTQFFRRPAQYIRGRQFEVMLNLWWSGNQLRQELEKVLVKDHPLENYRIEVEPSDLGRRILLVNARRLYQRETAPERLLVSLEDATELEEARQMLRVANEELEKRVIARTEALFKSYEQMESFCYSIAHDLRAPLRSMAGFSQLLTEQLGQQMDEKGHDYARRIQESAERMDHLVRDLLSYGQLNTAPLISTSVDLEKVFDEVLLQQDNDIQQKSAKVRKRGRLPVVIGHYAVCQAVLGNLISNALKFVAPGVHPRVTVFAEDKRSTARVWVADNGIGIEPENRERIFGVFQRLHTQEKYPGTGIGLAIVAKAVERMGGQVGLESEPGKGTRFWFELPQPKT